MKRTIKPYKIGMRSVKTAIAVFVCMLFYALLEGLNLGDFSAQNPVLKALLFLANRKDPIYACIAAIVATQSTIEDSWQRGKDRILGTFFGGAFGLVALYIDIAFYNQRFSIITVPLGVLFLIWVCNTISIQNAVPFAAITFIIVVVEAYKFSEPAYFYALNRTIDTAIGVLISMVVNLTFGKPKPLEEGETTVAQN